MKIHLKQIPDEGLHVEGEEPNGILDLKDIAITPTSPVHSRSTPIVPVAKSPPSLSPTSSE